MTSIDFIVYIALFCIGTLFGSFFTLAVYRIPLKKDITHEQSFCPNCNHKLNFLDLIPILSYICLGGKCRYCKQKIRPRYLLLEILSGIVFVLFAISIKFSTLHVLYGEWEVIAYLIMGILYIATLFIIAGIDKEKIKIEKPVILFGFICMSLYIIYLYIVGIDANIYRYVIYFIIFCILTIISTIYLRKKSKDSYPVDILMLLLLMVMYTYEVVCIYTIIITLLMVAIQLIIKKMKNENSKCVKLEKEKNTKIPFGFYLCVANILTLIITNLYIFFIL